MYQFLDFVSPTYPPNMGGTPTRDGQTDRVLPPSSPTDGILAYQTYGHLLTSSILANPLERWSRRPVPMRCSFCSGYHFPIDSINAACRPSAIRAGGEKLPLNWGDGAA